MSDDDISRTQDLKSQGESGNPSSAASFPAFRKSPSLSEDKEGDNSSGEGLEESIMGGPLNHKRQHITQSLARGKAQKTYM